MATLTLSSDQVGKLRREFRSDQKRPEAVRYRSHQSQPRKLVRVLRLGQQLVYA